MFWFDGKVLDEPRVPFDLRDRGLLLGDGLFETIAIFDRRAFLLDFHLERLLEGAANLGIPCDRTLCERAIGELARAFAGSDAILRLTLSRGVGERGLALPGRPRPVLFASAAPWSPPERVALVRLATSLIRRNDASPTARLKTLNYLDSVLAMEAARQAGADDALLLNTADRPVCTSAANLFVLRGAHLLTPPPVEGILAGTVRRFVLDTCSSLGLQASERPLTPQDLEAADAVFTTNSVRLVQQVAALDGRALDTSSGVPEAIRSMLRRAMKAKGRRA